MALSMLRARAWKPRLHAARRYLLAPSLKCGDALFERSNASLSLADCSHDRAT